MGQMLVLDWLAIQVELDRLGMPQTEWRNTPRGRTRWTGDADGHHVGELPGRQQGSNYGFDKATTDYGRPS
jgi:hypothetical protein